MNQDLMGVFSRDNLPNTIRSRELGSAVKNVKNANVKNVLV